MRWPMCDVAAGVAASHARAAPFVQLGTAVLQTGFSSSRLSILVRPGVGAGAGVWHAMRCTGSAAATSMVWMVRSHIGADLGVLVSVQPAWAVAGQHIWVAGALIQPRASVVRRLERVWWVVSRTLNLRSVLVRGAFATPGTTTPRPRTVLCLWAVPFMLRWQFCLYLSACHCLYCVACVGLLSQKCLLL